jgi:hypothetical protein
LRSFTLRLPGPETDVLVEDVDDALKLFLNAGNEVCWFSRNETVGSLG